VTVNVSNPTTNSGGGTSGPETLTITPIGVTALTINPTTELGGTPATGTVTLGSPAPSGGTVVTLSDNGALITVADVQPSVTVLQGATTATFPIVTHVVGTQTVVTITATVGLTSQMATLTLTPAAAGAFGAGLRFFSLPYAYSDTTLENIFLIPPMPDELFVYNAQQLQYDKIVDPTVMISPGLAYWGIFPAGGSTLNFLGTPTPTNAEVTINLFPGWNGIGDPFTTPVPVDSLTFTTSNTPFTTAIGTGFELISPTLFSFLQSNPGGTTGTYQPVTAGDSLAPGQGYWIFANFPTVINFPAP
jgi:hypothetical protein